MNNFWIGFLTCFLFLLLLGQMQKVVRFLRRKLKHLKFHKGPDEQIRTGEKVVAVLNSETPGKRVIYN